VVHAVLLTFYRYGVYYEENFPEVENIHFILNLLSPSPYARLFLMFPLPPVAFCFCCRMLFLFLCLLTARPPATAAATDARTLSFRFDRLTRGILRGAVAYHFQALCWIIS